jgi:hypothetical protein
MLPPKLSDNPAYFFAEENHLFQLAAVFRFIATDGGQTNAS